MIHDIDRRVKAGQEGSLKNIFTAEKKRLPITQTPPGKEASV
jgi:hypothetical protein